MSTDEKVFNALVEMGMEASLARAAAQRFTHIEPAINWCFEAGQNWDPSQDRVTTQPTARPVPPTPDFAKPGTTVEHHEVASHTSEHSARSPTSLKSPPLPARPQKLPHSPAPEPPQPLTFGDKNPFRNSTATSLNPFYQNKTEDVKLENDDDEDEALQRALAMSVEPSMDVDPPNYDEGRAERERSIRATAPPPSPTEKRAQMIGPMEEGSRAQSPSPAGQSGNSLALVPHSMKEQGPTRSKEEEDMEKAIADSLMTASFHSSASAPRNLYEPTQVPRKEGTPMILYSESGQAASTANLLQALVAIPRIQAMAEKLHEVSEDTSLTTLLWEIILRESETRDSFAPIDEIALEIYGKLSNTNELPPVPRLIDAWQAVVDDAEDLYKKALPGQREQWAREELPSTEQLFQNVISHISKKASYVSFWRGVDTFDIHSGMVTALWANGASNNIHEASDILVVMLGWQMNPKREVWKLEQKVVIDRYMTNNVTWSLNIRAETGVAQGKARRLKEKLDRLTTHKGNSIEASLKSVIKHYETTLGRDEMQQEQRLEMKEKLQKTLAQLQVKVADINKEIKAEMKAAHGGLFNTDDPQYNQHVYRLVAVLYHDGALMGQGHLYMYLLGEGDQWWKIQDHEATPVDWSAVASDSTGLYMDGGPYTLIYDRESPRAEPYGSELEGQLTRFRETYPEHATPRPPPRNDGHGVASQAETETSHHEYASTQPTTKADHPASDLVGDAASRTVSQKPLPRPLPPVPDQQSATSDSLPSKKDEDEDVTMS